MERSLTEGRLSEVGCELEVGAIRTYAVLGKPNCRGP